MLDFSFAAWKEAVFRMKGAGRKRELDMTPDTTPVIAGRPLTDTTLPPPPPAEFASHFCLIARRRRYSLPLGSLGRGLKPIPGRAPCGVAAARLAVAAQARGFCIPKTFLSLVEGRNSSPQLQRFASRGQTCERGCARLTREPNEPTTSNRKEDGAELA